MPGAILAYYDEVRSQAGGQNEIDEFLRLFMIPGFGHCFEPPSLSTEWFDPLSALEDWVERAAAPDRPVAERHGPAGRTTRTRPLRSYSEAARYSGSGSIDDAASFDCVLFDDEDMH